MNLYALLKKYFQNILRANEDVNQYLAKHMNNNGIICGQYYTKQYQSLNFMQAFNYAR